MWRADAIALERDAFRRAVTFGSLNESRRGLDDRLEETLSLDAVPIKMSHQYSMNIDQIKCLSEKCMGV